MKVMLEMFFQLYIKKYLVTSINKNLNNICSQYFVDVWYEMFYKCLIATGFHTHHFDMFSVRPE